MLYPDAMGAAFDDLPEALQVFHAVEDSHLYKGLVTVSHGGALARRVAKSGGMPGKSGEMPFSFRATRDGDHEIWERNFDGHVTRSLQWLHAPGVVAERVGTSEFLMAPEVRDERLHIPITGVTAFGLKLPPGVLRSCEGVEHVTEDGGIAFDVHAEVKGLGLIIRYRGVLYGPVEG
ncbi:DUF4166 domain-containing protein [Hasllibacter sp. MH4015]|uniref:DUF4166 domain-containing protein n=1 Tax=Hasllibacter sp. MH4015 TaxID=2854029 RepID=UPI001CD4014E|nr:DUF4166 domain-containing protein [Hasllibacter sp. MH4015]